MGQKRSFDEDCLQELSFKQPKQLDSTEQAALLTEINHPSDVSHKTDISGDALGNHCHSQSKDGSNAASGINSKEFKTNAPGSWGTSSSMEEDMGSRTVLYSSVFPELFEFSFPRRNIIQFEDVYSSLSNSSPRKEVSVGPNHQADVPIWDPDVTKKHPLHSIDGNIDYTGEFMMGSCVIPMPELEFSDVVCNTMDSKLDCNCLDGGSSRCVQQHVKEAREELKDTIGLEKFVNLGFLEMGEEVSSRWTEEEEQLFHEVVYSNPMLHGRNFWVHLSTMFPSRRKAEIVSYYFNVFMLRRRAAQNKSSWMEIDSDDDEWKGIGGSFGMTGEDEKSAAASFINQDVHVDHGDVSQNDYDDDDDSSDDNDDNNGGVEHESDDNDGGDLQVGEVYGTENMEEKYLLSKKNNESSLDGHMSPQLAQPHGSFKELPTVQENSCTSCEIQPPVTGSHHPINERAALQGNRGIGAGGNLLEGHGDGSTDKFGCQYALESCDSKVWDVTYPIGLMTSLDLLPTCNMMEEIFGPCNWNKSSKDKSVS